MQPLKAVSSSLLPPVGLEFISIEQANELLVAWGHYLGPCNRPFGMQAFALHLHGQPVSISISASAVSGHIPVGDREYQRGEIVELARLCSCEPWATRVMLRLWREVGAKLWPYWPVTAAIAYSQNSRHEGDIYRFDGWERVRDNCGSSGGGAWSRKRYSTDAARGKKTLWLWRYGGGSD